MQVAVVGRYGRQSDWARLRGGVSLVVECQAELSRVAFQETQHPAGYRGLLPSMRSSLTPRNERGTKLAVNMEQRRWTRFCACVRKLRTCTLRERSRRAARLTAAQCYDTATKPSRSARRVGHIYRCRLHTCTSRERPRTKAADSPRDLDMFEMKGLPAGM